VLRFRRLSKYELAAELCVQTPIRVCKPLRIEGALDPRVELHENGTLIIRPGYNWDGPSGPAIDTESAMRASLAHDALYDLIDRGLLASRHRKAADEVLHRLALEDGMPWWRALYFYLAVRLFGWAVLLFARRSKEKPC
jgi:hypothetical protein